jgi:hypothetical protein
LGCAGGAVFGAVVLFGEPFGEPFCAGGWRVISSRLNRFCAGTAPWLGPGGAGGRIGTFWSRIRRLSVW